jgi:arylsulfatase A-like enzyme
MTGHKGMLTEGGLRAPYLAVWPGRLAAGTVYEQPVVSLDVATTAVALAGLPEDASLDGTNLLPFLEGKAAGAPHEHLFWRWGSQAAILEHPRKLTRLGDREQLLFDVTQPEGEMLERDLLKTHPKVAARLEKALKA